MKIGICGTGDISVQFMEHALIEGIEVVGVLNRSLQKAKDFASKYNIENYTDSYVELLSVCDWVYLGIPNSLHYGYTKEAILNGNNVLMEKPVTSNMKEFEELVSLAKEHNVYIFEINRVTCLPHFRYIQEELKDSKEALVQVDFCKLSRRYYDYIDGKNPHVFSLEYSGGALYDLGVYGLHFVVGLLGKPNSYSYACHKMESGVDDLGVLTLNYDNQVCSVSHSKISNGRCGMLIQTPDITISSDTSVSQLTTLKITKDKKDNIVSDQDAIAITYLMKDIVRIINENDMDAYNKQIEQSRLVLEIMENCRKQNDIVFDADKK